MLQAGELRATFSRGLAQGPSLHFCMCYMQYQIRIGVTFWLSQTHPTKKIVFIVRELKLYGFVTSVGQNTGGRMVKFLVGHLFGLLQLLKIRLGICWCVYKQNSHLFGNILFGMSPDAGGGSCFLISLLTWPGLSHQNWTPGKTQWVSPKFLKVHLTVQEQDFDGS